MSRNQRFNKNFVLGGVYDPKAVKFAQFANNQLPPSPVQNTVNQKSTNIQQPQIQAVQENNDVTNGQKQEETQQLQGQMEYQSNNEVDQANSTNNQDNNDGNIRVQFKQIFLTRKKSSVRAKERKIRQNRQLRRAIFPKNALMALNEVKGITTSDFVINSFQNGFIAIVTVNGNQYEGTGASKVLAKNDACEKALRDYVLKKMTLKPRNQKHNQATGEPMNVDNGDSDSTMDSQKPSSLADDDDVPMVNLASFALFKLFKDWENQGFTVPELHPDAQNGASPESEKKVPKAAVRTELPVGWETMHPATVLCMMRPGVTYKDCPPTDDVDKSNAIQRVSVEVDGLDYFGAGRSKKIARRNAATAVCNSLFGTNYSLEESLVN